MTLDKIINESGIWTYQADFQDGEIERLVEKMKTGRGEKWLLLDKIDESGIWTKQISKMES